MYEIKCAVCGRTVTAKSLNKKYCADCAKTVHLEAGRRLRQRRAAQAGGKRSAKSVKEINAEARAHGMSYGQWVAQMEARKNV